MSTKIQALLSATWLTLTLVASFAPHVLAQQTSAVAGRIMDARDGTALPHATVVLIRPPAPDIYAGSSTDDGGRFRLSNIQPGRYTMSVSYVGYQRREFPIALEQGQIHTMDIALAPEATALEPVVVSASAQLEKALDAPASVSVLTDEEIERDVAPSPADALRFVPGVDIARTGIDRREIVVRGFNNAFSGAAYVMTDYRQSAIASLGVNAYNMMPVNSVDLERIEIVRGPAGALYGPGVDDGVIHFITKDPFDHPGTTVALTGGEQAMLGAQIRHAGVVGERLGYKINGLYQEANDWRLDPTDPHDADVITNYHQMTPRMRNVNKTNVNGTLAYRFNPMTSLTASAGYGSATSAFLSDIGVLQSDGFGYRYGQIRLRSGRFFAQAYVNKNETGESFVYAGPAVASSLSGESVVDRSTQINLQAQHGVGLLGNREQITFGVDFERTNPVTEGTITGRNEGDDLILEYGAYAQSQTAISDKLSVIFAARLDYDNVFETMQVSPRAAIVYKPSPEHALRATFNRAFASPSTNSLFLDIVAREPQEAFPFIVRARGGAFGFTFDRNPAYSAVAGTDLVASSLNPQMLGAEQPVGLPLDQVYRAIYEALTAAPAEYIQQELAARGIQLSIPAIEGLRQMLSPEAGTNVQGFTRGRLGLLNLTTRTFDPIDDLSNIAPLRQSSTRTIEVGYKGILGRSVVVAVDGYYTVKSNFVRGLRLETPFVTVPGLRNDILSAMEMGIEGNEALAQALEQLNLPASAVAELIASMAESRLPTPDTPVALVQPVENHAGTGNMPELMLSYRNFGRVAYYGLDVSTHLTIGGSTTAFGTLSYVSDDFFDHDELDETNEDLFVALNASALKVSGGLSHRFRGGLFASLSGRWSRGYRVRSGPFNGDIDDAFLLDAGVGFDFMRFAPGLRLDVTVQNVLDHDHREFIGAPRIGRLGTARLTYSL